EVAAADFFLHPGTDITRMTALRPNEILVGVRLPTNWAGKPYYFEKVADRKSWDFALVSIASTLDLAGGVVRSSRIVVGGVAARPLRLRAVEDSLNGASIDQAALERAAMLAVEGARPLRYNGYKVALTRNLVKRAIQRASV